MSGGVEITGLTELQRNIEKAIAANEMAVLDTLRSIGDVAVYESVLCAPIDEGHLSASIEKSLQKDGGTPTVVVRIPLNSPASEYALAMHEDDYQLGPLSQKKQSRAGVIVGRKFITRGIQNGWPKYQIIIKKRMGV